MKEKKKKKKQSISVKRWPIFKEWGKEKKKRRALKKD